MKIIVFLGVVLVGPYKVFPVGIIQRVNLPSQGLTAHGCLLSDGVIQIEVYVPGNPVAKRPFGRVVLFEMAPIAVGLEKVIHDLLSGEAIILDKDGHFTLDAVI